MAKQVALSSLMIAENIPIRQSRKKLKYMKILNTRKLSKAKTLEPGFKNINLEVTKFKISLKIYKLRPGSSVRPIPKNVSNPINILI